MLIEEAMQLKSTLVESLINHPGHPSLKLINHQSTDLCGGTEAGAWFWVSICGPWNHPNLDGKIITWYGAADGERLETISESLDDAISLVSGILSPIQPPTASE